MRRHPTKFIVLAMLSVACGKQRDPDMEYDHRKDFAIWTQKLVDRLILRDKPALQGILSRFDPKSEDELIEEILKYDGSADGFADFMLFFLGFKSDSSVLPVVDDPESTHTESSGMLNVYSFPVAIYGALKLHAQQDVFEAFDWNIPIPIRPLLKDSLPLRRNEREKLKRKFIALVESIKSSTVSQLCPNQWATLFDIRKELLQLGSNMDLSNRSGWLGHVVDAFTRICQRNRSEEFLDASTLSLIDSYSLLVLREFDLIGTYDLDVYAPVKIKDIEFIPREGFDYLGRYVSSWEFFWKKIPNTASNHNRKRAHYVLKRFFCDDLTPISIVQGDDSAGPGHANQPECVSCHYKLDPMAGFFRFTGFDGRDRTASTYMDFSTGSPEPLSNYVSNWIMRRGEKILWNVGYVGQEGYSHQTAESIVGTGLDDLMKLLRTSPIVKRCFVRRMFEYYIGTRHVIDSDLLEREQNKMAESRDSYKSFLSTLKIILKSRAFKMQNLTREKCLGEFNLSGNVSCEVSAYLNKHCLSCHNTQSSSGGLNFEVWLTGDDRFLHRDKNNQELSRADSYTRILKRINTSDATFKMPPGANIPDQERDILYKWFEGQLRQ